jgi:MoaA/NifB/PqqE/SkfB family radical SAM enzyme
MQAIADLAGQKKALRAATPTISIAYLLFRSHLQDMNKLVSALAGSGAEQVVISTLDFVSHKSLFGERLAPTSLTQYRELEFLFKKLEGEAEKKDINLFYNLVLHNTAGRACTENPRRALFISSDGSVSPCVFSNIPAKDAMHIGIGEEDEYQTLTFGCVTEELLPVIWKRPSYRAFRKHFGLQPYTLCENCPKRYKRTDEGTGG